MKRTIRSRSIAPVSIANLATVKGGVALLVPDTSCATVVMAITSDQKTIIGGFKS